MLTKNSCRILLLRVPRCLMSSDRLDIDSLDIEPFIELFTDNVVFVGPYNENDARNMMQDLVKRNNKKYDTIHSISCCGQRGRYAGLMRSRFRSLDFIGALDPNTVMTMSDQVVRDLAVKRPVRMECETIWKSLTPKEQSLLREFAGPKPNVDPNDPDTQQVFAVLQQKKLLSVQGNHVVIEPPLFYTFILNNPDESA